MTIIYLLIVLFNPNRFGIFTFLNSCGVVEVPEGYKNVPDRLKRFPDCCVNIVKIENGTKIDNVIRIETTTSLENMIRVENSTKFEANIQKLVESTTKIDEKVRKISNSDNTI